MSTSRWKGTLPAILAACLLLTGGCVATTTGTVVTRTDPNDTAGGDLSGEWNDIDANMVAEEMINDCLTRPWLEAFKAQNMGRKPVIRFHSIKNRSSDRIDTKFFSKQVERALLNSGQVEILAAMDEMNDVFNEQELAASKGGPDAGDYSQEPDADFILNGWVVSQNETDGYGRTVKAYLVTMELINAKSTQKVWIGEKRIRKVVDQAAYTW